MNNTPSSTDRKLLRLSQWLPVLLLVGISLFFIVREALKESIPAAPDYALASQWYIQSRGGEADLFYIVSTETGDYETADGTTCHYADTYAASSRQALLGEMEGVDALLSGKLNYYSPYYRQCSLESFVSEDLWTERLKLPAQDVKKAFSWYLEHENGGRPFILAGFSQGAMLALELLREMDRATYDRMVAAYIIGTIIPAESTYIVPAQGAGDTGVTICYNSVRDASCNMWERSSFAINPVNWCTDATPATWETEPSPLIPVDEQQKERLTATLDPESNLLFVDGYSATDYVLPLIGREGNYHSREIWLYRNSLRDNMQLRVHNWLNK